MAMKRRAEERQKCKERKELEDKERQKKREKLEKLAMETKLYQQDMLDGRQSPIFKLDSPNGSDCGQPIAKKAKVNQQPTNYIPNFTDSLQSESERESDAPLKDGKQRKTSSIQN